jgi:plastocyanin
MRRAMTAVLATGAAVTAVAVPASAGAETKDVAAAGNIVTGGLEFAPATVALRVGDVVRWTNTDFLVPHTATEDHDLWDLAGSYGGTGLTPAGFGPGAVVQRTMEAGTTHYFCRVHPQQMRGVISVPVDLATRLRRIRTHGRARTVQDITATWATAAPPAGRAYDVQVRRGGGDWATLRDGTSDTSATVRAGAAGTVTAVRARLRDAGGSGKATDWSPDASVTSSQPATPRKKHPHRR